MIKGPDLLGTGTGGCVICRMPTGTGLGFKGEGDWFVAGLYVLGIPLDQAAIMVAEEFGCDPGMVPGGTETMVVMVCRECVAKSKLAKSRPDFPEPGLLGPGHPLPVVGQ